MVWRNGAISLAHPVYRALLSTKCQSNISKRSRSCRCWHKTPEEKRQNTHDTRMSNLTSRCSQIESTVALLERLGDEDILTRGLERDKNNYDLFRGRCRKLLANIILWRKCGDGERWLTGARGRSGFRCFARVSRRQTCTLFSSATLRFRLIRFLPWKIRLSKT